LGCNHGDRLPVLLARWSKLVDFARGFVAFLEGGNPFWDVVLFNHEVFGAEAGDIVPLVVSDGNVELYEYDVYVEARGFVLGRGPRCSSQKEKEAREYFKVSESSV
jgi:hypothetical protein